MFALRAGRENNKRKKIKRVYNFGRFGMAARILFSRKERRYVELCAGDREDHGGSGSEGESEREEHFDLFLGGAA